MPVQATQIKSQSAFGITLYHNLIVQEPASDKLMILLPGRGYTVESPLFHYLTQIGLQEKFDVLAIRYAIHHMQVDNWFERLHDIQADCDDAVEQALHRGYEQVCIVGKSLGTPIAGMLANIIDIDRKSVLMLTPIQDAMKLITDIPALAIIGTADPAYNPDMVTQSATESWQVYEGLNHGLEYAGDWQKSLTILPEILSLCAKFIHGND